jgi:uncharacterized protein
VNTLPTASMETRPAIPAGAAPRISSLLIKPVSAMCNLNCTYCFYVERQTDPYKSLPSRRMSSETLERLVDGYLFYSYPNSVFAFQGGEPMLAGQPFYEHLVRLQQQYRRSGQAISNIMQTNGILIDESWCCLFREHHWLVGLSLDGPAEMHDRYRSGKQGKGTWREVVNGVERLKKNGVQFNVLCVLSQANVAEPEKVYRFFRSLGVDHIQYIPLSDHDSAGCRLPFTVTPEQYGRFMCDTFDLWWPERRHVRIRCFDNIAEAMAGQRPSNCSMQATCDSYVVVEYNGGVYPCDFFVEKDWLLGNITVNSWTEIARSRVRYAFATRKAALHPACRACEYQSICRGGCPRHRGVVNGSVDGLDYFCPANRTILAKVAGPLADELDYLLGSRVFRPATTRQEPPGRHGGVLSIRDSVSYSFTARSGTAADHGLLHRPGLVADCSGGRFAVRARRPDQSLP